MKNLISSFAFLLLSAAVLAAQPPTTARQNKTTTPSRAARRRFMVHVLPRRLSPCPSSWVEDTRFRGRPPASAPTATARLPTPLEIEPAPFIILVA